MAPRLVCRRLGTSPRGAPCPAALSRAPLFVPAPADHVLRPAHHAGVHLGQDPGAGRVLPGRPGQGRRPPVLPQVPGRTRGGHSPQQPRAGDRATMLPALCCCCGPLDHTRGTVQMQFSTQRPSAWAGPRMSLLVRVACTQAPHQLTPTLLLLLAGAVCAVDGVRWPPAGPGAVLPSQSARQPAALAAAAAAWARGTRGAAGGGGRRRWAVAGRGPRRQPGCGAAGQVGLPRPGPHGGGRTRGGGGERRGDSASPLAVGQRGWGVRSHARLRPSSTPPSTPSWAGRMLCALPCTPS